MTLESLSPAELFIPSSEQKIARGPFAPQSIGRKIKQFRRDVRNVIFGQLNKTTVNEPFPDHGYRILGSTSLYDGLGRAYRYEIERLDAAGLINPQSRNVLILGQPRIYRSLFRKQTNKIAGTYRIGLWVTEFETFPPDWRFALNIVNEIWTPTDFSARAFRSVTSLPIKIVPHAVKMDDGPTMDRARFGISQSQFLGLAIMDLESCPERKNPIAHIKAWQQAFGEDASAQLLIKARFSRENSAIRQTMLEAIGTSPNIRIIEAEFSDADMASFQRMADVYLSLHRAEGYGLNIHQMLELKKPVIATGWSGNMEFMPRYPNAHAVPYRLVPYADETQHYRGATLKWADADIGYAAIMLKNIQASHKAFRSLDLTLDAA